MRARPCPAVDLTAVAFPLSWIAAGWRAAVPLLVLAYLALGEATLTGIALTLAVVYRPQWVATFDDARYPDGRQDAAAWPA